MNELFTLRRRLEKIGIDIELIGNSPWIYLTKVNELPVTDKFKSEHGFVIAMNYGKDDMVLTDSSEVFKTIRKYLCGEQTKLQGSIRIYRAVDDWDTVEYEIESDGDSWRCSLEENDMAAVCHLDKSDFTIQEAEEWLRENFNTVFSSETDPITEFVRDGE